MLGSRQLRLGILLLLVVGMLTSCGGGGGGGGGGRGTPSASPSSTEEGQRDRAGSAADGAEVADELRFSADAVDGGAQVVGADYAGRDVALWFWAPW